MDRPSGQRVSDYQRAGEAPAERAPGDTNVVSIGKNLTAEQNTLRAETVREHQPQELLDALPTAVYTTDAEGRLTYYNSAAAELWGYRPQLGTSEWCGSWKLFAADGTPMRHDQCPMAIALKEDRAVRGVEAACERPDGTRVPFIPYPTPLHDETGRLTGAINMLVDISDRKRAEEQQALLTRELHHRVKNTLATVQAIMGSTARSAESIDDFTTALIGRIGSLAKTHRLLTDEDGAASFGSLLHNELDAFDDGSEGRITLDGPEIALSPQLAVSLGMAVHELTINAAKYGALSVYGGKVDVTWHVAVEPVRRLLTIDWVERGGPPVTGPKRHGFGSRLLDSVLPGQIEAKSSLDWRPEGLHLHCEVPLPPEPATSEQAKTPNK